ncbi:MAG: hypothetical protein Q8S36_00210 [Sulfuricurvum sp.]|nr:hypothetical protein [Sulfuricurvum sp.]
MMTIDKEFRLGSSVIAMNGDDKLLYLIDNSCNLYILDKSTFEFSKPIPIASKFSIRHPYDNALSISSNLELIIASPDDAKSFLVRYTSKPEVIETLDYNDKSVSCSRFSHDNRILTIGGEDGKVFFYDMQQKQLIGSLKTVPDSISAITYSEDKRFVAVSSFDKGTVIFNLDRNVVFRDFKLEDFAIEQSLFVANDTKLIGLTRHKTLVMYDVQSRATSISLFEIEGWPTQIVAIGSNHVIVATKAQKLYIIDHTTFKITTSLTLSNAGVTKMVLQNDYLYISYLDGEVQIINTQLYAKELAGHLRINDFKEATAKIRQNLFLLTKEMVNKYDKLWPSTLEKVKQLIFTGKIDEAFEMANPFFLDPRKEEQYNFCLGNIDSFQQLFEFIEEKKYVEAHAYCDEYTYLKQTKEYEVLDKQWISLFQSSKHLYFKNDSTSHASAKAMLKPYLSVPSKKILIENLHSEYKTFMKADEYIRERNFKGYFELVGNNSFLKSEEMYNRVIQIANQTYDKLKALQKEEQYDDALKVAMYLKDFTPLREKVASAVELLNLIKQMILWIHQNQISKVYESVNTYRELESIEPFIRYHEAFRALEKQAWEYAKQGNSAWIVQNLSPYVRQECTMHTIGQIIKKSYLQEFRQACETRSSSLDFGRTIKQYTALFGVDNELFYLAKTQKFNNMLRLDDKSANERGYETKEYPSTILVLTND